MKQHLQILLANIDKPNQYKLSVFEQNGGYKAIRKALGMDPKAIVDEVVKSGIRGRGGAGFPTGKKWTFIPQNSGKPVYLINNADESEPGTFKDRLLIERDPHMILEGMMIAGVALRSHTSFIYIRGEYGFGYTRLKAAIDEAYAAGYLGDNIFGSGFKHDIIIHRGAGAYICGEETALLESLEGKKGQPRLKPPFYPAVIGLYGCPTLVNNTETYANIPWITMNGGDAYAKLGVPGSTGTKLVSASGHINKPGVYEIEMGYPLIDFINNECGGVWKGRKIKCVIPGGSSVIVLRGDELEGVNLDFESLKTAGSALGSAGFMVLDDQTDMVAVLQNLAHFYAHESCGQCTPCREGGHWVEKIAKRIVKNEGLPGDTDLITNLCDQIGGHTICAFGDTMVLPYRSIIKKYPEEFKRRIYG